MVRILRVVSGVNDCALHALQVPALDAKEPERQKGKQPEQLPRNKHGPTAWPAW